MYFTHYILHPFRPLAGSAPLALSDPMYTCSQCHSGLLTHGSRSLMVTCGLSGTTEPSALCYPLHSSPGAITGRAQGTQVSRDEVQGYTCSTWGVKRGWEGQGVEKRTQEQEGGRPRVCWGTITATTTRQNCTALFLQSQIRKWRQQKVRPASITTHRQVCCSCCNSHWFGSDVPPETWLHRAGSPWGGGSGMAPLAIPYNTLAENHCLSAIGCWAWKERPLSWICFNFESKYCKTMSSSP